MRKGNILIPKGQKERKSVTFAIRLCTIWYDREGVKFRDSGGEIERNIAKRQICHTLPERSVGTSCGTQRFLFRSKYDSSYANFTTTLAYYVWYLVIATWRSPSRLVFMLGWARDNVFLFRPMILLFTASLITKDKND